MARHLLPLGLWLAAVALTCGADLGAAVKLAFHHPTYHYCLLVPPIAAALAWRRRRQLAEVAPRHCGWGVAAAAGAAAVWWASPFAELRQLAVVAMALGGVLATLGPELCRRFALPLLYLFLAVPLGTPLVAPLQLTTTWLTAALLQLCAIPTTVEGVVITVPLRAYSVDPGCAGLNFLLAAAALAPLYAWQHYAGAAKRLVAVAAALVLAVLANAVRVWGMIALAEVTAGGIDLGPRDHLLHGWVLFSGVMAVAMLLGLRHRDVV